MFIILIELLENIANKRNQVAGKQNSQGNLSQDQEITTININTLINVLKAFFMSLCVFTKYVYIYIYIFFF